MRLILFLLCMKKEPIYHGDPNRGWKHAGPDLENDPAHQLENFDPSGKSPLPEVARNVVNGAFLRSKEGWRTLELVQVRYLPRPVQDAIKAMRVDLAEVLRVTEAMMAPRERRDYYFDTESGKKLEVA